MKAQEQEKKFADVEFKLPFQFDTNVTGNALLDWLSQFCILSDAKKAQFGKVFTFFDAAKANYLTPIEVCCLRLINRRPGQMEPMSC